MKPIIAAIQMTSSHSVDDNLAFANHAIAKAASQGAKLIVLPEMFTLMGLTEKDKIEQKEIFKKGKIQSALSAIAKSHRVWLVAGTIPLACKNKNKVKAACLVFDDTGHLVTRYDKLFLFDVTLSNHEHYHESETTQAGKDPIVFETPFGRVGLAVCYDIRFPELFCYYASQEVDILIIPAAFTVKTGPHWKALCVARAIENFCYVVGACQVGKHTNGRVTYGHSMIVDPWGKVIAALEGDKPGIIYGEIDLQYVKSVRNTIPALSQRKKL